MQVHSNRLGGRSDCVSVLCRYILIDWVVEVEVTLCVSVVQVYSNILGGRRGSVCLCCAGIF